MFCSSNCRRVDDLLQDGAGVESQLTSGGNAGDNSASATSGAEVTCFHGIEGEVGGVVEGRHVFRIIRDVRQHVIVAVAGADRGGFVGEYGRKRCRLARFEQSRTATTLIAHSESVQKACFAARFGWQRWQRSQWRRFWPFILGRVRARIFGGCVVFGVQFLAEHARQAHLGGAGELVRKLVFWWVV